MDLEDRLSLMAIIRNWHSQGSILTANEARSQFTEDELLGFRKMLTTYSSSYSSSSAKQDYVSRDQFQVLCSSVVKLTETIEDMRKMIPSATVSRPPEPQDTHQQAPAVSSVTAHARDSGQATQVVPSTEDTSVHLLPHPDEFSEWQEDNSDIDQEQQPDHMSYLDDQGEIDTTRQEQILEASTQVLSHLGLQCQPERKARPMSGFGAKVTKVQVAFPLHENIRLFQQQLAKGKGCRSLVPKGVNNSYRVMLEDFALLGSYRVPDMILTLKAPSKTAPRAKGDIKRAILSKPELIPYESSLINEDNAIVASIRTSNTALTALDVATSLLESLDLSGQAGDTISQVLSAVQLATTAVWDTADISLRVHDTLQRERRSLWLDQCGLGKDMTSYAKSRPLPSGSVSDQGELVPPTMCGPDLAEYIKKSAQLSTNLEKVLHKAQPKRPSYAIRGAPPAKRARGYRGASSRGRSQGQQRDQAPKEDRQQEKQSFRGRGSSRGRAGKQQRGKPAKF